MLLSSEYSLFTVNNVNHTSQKLTGWSRSKHNQTCIQNYQCVTKLESLEILFREIFRRQFTWKKQKFTFPHLQYNSLLKPRRLSTPL